jgi:hypothetical protein
MYCTYFEVKTNLLGEGVKEGGSEGLKAEDERMTPIGGGNEGGTKL